MSSAPQIVASTAEPITALAWAPNAPIVASGSEKGSVAWWEAGSRGRGAAVTSVEAHRAAVTALAFTPDGSVLASGGFDGKIGTWDVRSGTAKRTWPADPAGHAKALAFSPRGTLLASASDRGVQLWDPGRGTLVREIPSSRGVVHTAFSPDGRMIVTAGGAGVVLVDVESGAIVRQLLGPGTELSLAVCVSRDGQLVAAGGTGQVLRLWEATTGRLVRSVDSNDFIRSLAFRPDTSALTVASRTGAHVVPLGSAVPKPPAQHESPFSAVAVSAGGLMWAGGTKTGEVRTFRIE